LPLSFSRVRSWISVTSGVRFSSQISHLVHRFSVSLLGIREALLVNGLLAILVQALIGRRWDRMPDPGSPDALSPVRGPRRAS
jgi:hypothetical protein